MASGKNKLKIVLDTNVYVSALLFSGIPDGILELVRESRLELLVSSSILLELGRILRNKFKFPRREVLYALSEIRRIATVVAPKTKVNIVKDDDADNRILECAVDGQADYIITGDKKHLRPLSKYREIKILLPSEFIKEVTV